MLLTDMTGAPLSRRGRRAGMRAIARRTVLASTLTLRRVPPTLSRLRERE